MKNFYLIHKFMPLILTLFFAVDWIDAGPKKPPVDPFQGVDVEAVERMPLAGRIQFAKAFFKWQSQQMEKGELEATVAKDKCNPDEKFDRCCYQIDFSCPFWVDPDQLRKDACKYPPNDLGSFQQICLGYYITKYIKCYADDQNHRDCCYKAGVPDECTWLFWTSDCGDFCDGTRPHYDAETGYHCCQDYVDKIAACNKKMANMSTDTAAVADKEPFCQRGCKPAWPEYCKQRNELEAALLKGIELSGPKKG